MAHRANPAGARGKRWHLGKRASFAKFFEAAKLRDMKLGILHLALVIQFDGDFRVALDAGDRIDHDVFSIVFYAPNRVLSVRSGVLSARSSVRTKWIVSADGGHPGTKTSTVTNSWTGLEVGSSRGITWCGTC